MRLTDLSIQKLPLQEKGQKTYRDDTVPGFGIRVGTRTKTFVVMYGKRRQLKTLGKYPSKTLRDARSEAKKFLATIEERTAPTGFLEASEAYLAECVERLRPATYRQYEFFLGQLPFDGDVADITRVHLLPYLTRPHATITYKTFFNWCIKNDIISRNPLIGERAIYNHPRTRVLSAEELKKVWEYEDPPFTNIVKLLILTGQRRNEISSIKEEWITDVITFPPTITKNKREHILPYGELTKQYLKPYSFNGWSKSKRRMDKALRVPHWTLHDLRRTFATIHAELGTPIHVTEKLLNHVSGTHGGIVQVYQLHTYLAEMKKAVETYEAHLATIFRLGQSPT
jgi:integrase